MIGVLALQGAFARHMQVVESLGSVTVEVREPADLEGLDGLIIPGGESTAMSKMLVRWNLVEPLRRLIQGGLPVFGTCAGLILLADRLPEWNDLPRPGGLNVTVSRNAYGRQLDSFEAILDISILGPEKMEGVFIRAPRISSDGVGEGVEVLCTFEGYPVLVRQQNILGAAFHPELTGDNRLHEWFLKELVDN